MINVIDCRGTVLPVRDSGREEAIERVIDSLQGESVEDRVIWEGGRVVAVIQAKGGGFPAIISP